MVFFLSICVVLFSRRLHFTSLRPFQDCKEFQGELFGICNLFRDLSDKLFTSEIIELHERQRHEHGQNLNSKDGLTERGTNFISSEEVGATYSSEFETRASKPVLEDMGMLVFVLLMLILYENYAYPIFLSHSLVFREGENIHCPLN